MTRTQYLGFIGLLIISFTAYMDYIIANVALPYIQATFSIPVVSLMWVSTLYYLPNAALMISMGKLGDLFGHKKLLFIGVICFALSSALCGFANSTTVLFIGRFLLGASAAILFPVSVSTLSLYAGNQHRSKALSILSLCNGLGIAIGPLLGGFLISYLNWRSVFLINIPMVCIGLYFLLRYVNFTQPLQAVKIDYLGMLLLFLTVAALTMAVTQSAQYGWLAHASILYYIVTLTSLILLIRVERKAEEPLLTFEFFKHPLFSLAFLFCAAVGAGISSLLFFMPLYLNDMKSYSADLSAWVLFAIPVMTLILPPFFPALLKRYKISSVIMMGSVALLISTISLSFFNVNTALTVIVIALMLAGFSWAVSMTMVNLSVQQALAEKFHGVGTGMAYAVYNVVSSVLLAIVVSIYHVIENRKSTALLNHINLQLSPTQTHAITTLLSDPSQMQTILQNTTPSLRQAVLSIFQQSFFAGMQSVMWIVSAVVLASIALSIVLLKKSKPKPIEITSDHFKQSF